jgi:sugar/nucleoside kinase (ribokinase family)
MGTKIPVDELVFETGGGATNAAVTFARFGFKTACITRVGDDVGGREILEQLEREKISTRGVQSDRRNRTAYSIILLSGSGSRAILVARSAASRLDHKIIPWDKLAASWLYVSSLAGNEKLLARIFEQAKLRRAQVAWNPGNGEIELGLKKLLPRLMQCDVLILNRQEAAAVAGKSPRDLPGILKILGPLPRICLLVTDGAHGAYAHANGQTWHAVPPRARIINTTGAGDAFGSAFTAAVMRQGDVVTALKIGALNARGVITNMGAKAGILRGYPAGRDFSRIKVGPAHQA